LEGWRPPYIQRRMFAWSFRRFKDRYPDWSETRLRRLASQFTAPMDEHVPPPHTTGGAIDLMLANENNEVLDHLSPYVPRDHKAFPFAAAGLSDDARRHRDMLAQAFSTGAMTNYPSEYWHWSYGDQGWAYRGRHEHALYSAVTPEGWEPSALDDTDEPLTWVMG